MKSPNVGINYTQARRRKVMQIRKLAMLLVGILLIVIGWIDQSGAEVNVNVGVFSPPPEYVVPTHPTVVVIPGTYVYFTPGLEVDILFHHGYWWRPYEGRWYRSRSYNGPWGYIRSEGVPNAIRTLPPDYRRVPPDHERIPHDQLKKNWGRWEKERHWDRREDRREDRQDMRDRGEKGGRDDRGEGYGRGERR
jgi:hypothetical protein